MTSDPTTELYHLLRCAYDHFNDRLFAGRLPGCMLTVQRQRNTVGYFCGERWCNGDGRMVHEIALNPAYFAHYRVVDILQTLVHEQCHLWQHVYGRHRSRSGYHNREWARKMTEVGLIASASGAPGGRQTGQSMSDYPAAAGPFLTACEALLRDGFHLPWIDTWPAAQQFAPSRPRVGDADGVDTDADTGIADALTRPLAALFPAITPGQATERQRRRLSKSKYTCGGCAANVWGKPGLDIRCGRCGEVFQIAPSPAH